MEREPTQAAKRTQKVVLPEVAASERSIECNVDGSFPVRDPRKKILSLPITKSVGIEACTATARDAIRWLMIDDHSSSRFRGLLRGVEGSGASMGSRYSDLMS